MRSSILFVVSMLVPLLCAGDDLPRTLQLPTRLVVTETEPSPATVTTTEVIDTITPGVWYVIRSKTPLYVLDFPTGSVSIISGVASADGIFAGGNGKPESRVFDAKESTYLIQGQKPCKCEIALIPVGVTERSAIVRQVLTISGAGPNPPPEPPAPTPDDPPVPDDKPKPETTSFRVIFVKESGQTLPAAQTAIPAAKAIRDYLIAKTTKDAGVSGFREYDPQQIVTNEQPVMQALWSAVQPKLMPAPCLVVEVNGHATVMQFPGSVEECLATLKRYGGE